MKYGKQEFNVLGFLENGLRDIHFGSNDYMYFWLKPISLYPKSVTIEPDKIQIYATELSRFGFEDERDSTQEAERAQKLKNFIENSLIICTPTFTRRDDDDQVYTRGSEIYLALKEQDFSPSSLYIPLPVFNKDSYSKVSSKQEFIQNTYKDNKIVGKTLNWSKEDEDFPINVIWQEDSDNYTIFGGIVGQNHSQYGVQYIISDDNQYELDISLPEDDWFYSSYRNEEEDVFFMNSKVLESKLKDAIEIKKNIPTEKITTVKNLDLKVESFENKEEDEFITRLHNISEQSHLHYYKKDLINFHTSIKGDSLTILSGLSGTGKTQLIRTYAKALNISDNQVSFIPVRPFWQDDTDLLGYADTINSVYRPGDSGLLDILIDASDNPNNMYLVCFDEMNIARVEHYFSQFLSVLELEPGKRKLRLYNPDLKDRLYNSSKYPFEVNIGPNVIFLGTINTDESTYNFSDKVLDRSNIISLEMIPFSLSERVEFESMNSNDTSKVSAYPSMKFEKFKNFKKSNSNNKLSEKEKDMFWKLHLEINKADKNVGIGWRILMQIDTYLQNIPKGDDLTRNQALDYQLSQRILTKIRGAEDQLTNLLGKYDNKSNSFTKGSMELILDEYLESSTFKKSRAVIEQKAKELCLHGFTI